MQYLLIKLTFDKSILTYLLNMFITEQVTVTKARFDKKNNNDTIININ